MLRIKNFIFNKDEVISIEYLDYEGTIKINLKSNDYIKEIPYCTVKEFEDLVEKVKE